MVDKHESVIGRYEYVQYSDPVAAYRSYDPRCPAVAQRVINLITAQMPDATVEHIGSTAIPECDGKGVVDLMLLYPPGRLAAGRETLDRLGFQRHDRPGAFSDDRPVRIGTIDHDGETFRLHVHVIAADAPEVVHQRAFRDTLRADPTFVAEYVARKRAVLAGGVSDSNDYNLGKDDFIKGVIHGQR